MVETHADIGKVSESIREVTTAIGCLRQLLRLPAISVPCGFDATRLPIGLQMVARSWDEFSTLDLASRYQRATLCNEQPPDL